MSEITRQHFLRLMAAGGASFFGLSHLFAAEEARGNLSPWGRLRFRCRGGDDDDWNVHPNGDLNLIDATNSSINNLSVEKRWNVADVSRLNELTAFPFLFMHAEMAPEFDDNARKNLREYLLRGGFLFAEDCVHGKHRSDGSGDEFFRRMAEYELPKIVPEAMLVRVPNDHPVFSCYHKLKEMPHMQGKRHGLHALVKGDRVLAFLSPSDLHCGWVNGDQWFGSGKQRQAFQMGMNIYLFAMTQSGSGLNKAASTISRRFEA